MMYIIGAYIKRYNLKLKLNKSIILYLFNLILIILVYLKGPKSISLAYNNPFIVNISIVVFILFKKIEISNNIAINKLSKGVFTVFLAHNFFLEFINRYYYVNKPTNTMLAHMIGSCIMIFIVCYICYVVYENTVNRTLKVISKKLNCQIYGVITIRKYKYEYKKIYSR